MKTTEAPHFIGGEWKSSKGPLVVSKNPSTGEDLWSGPAADKQTVDETVAIAREASTSWAAIPAAEREATLSRFVTLLGEDAATVSRAISLDVGKPRWEADIEVQIMIQKFEHTVRAYRERCSGYASGPASVRYRPVGVITVLGPFNFPGHLPNGHIMPALLAGNSVIFKPSDKAPLVAEETVKIWQASDLPAGVLNLLQGGVETATALAEHPGVDGLFFTGSSRAGLALSEKFASTPNRLLALEMGGNNALVIHAPGDLDAAAVITIQSAFQSAGQRCNCARRLLVTDETPAAEFLARLVELTKSLVIGSPDDQPPPFCGPLVTEDAAKAFLEKQDELRASGAKVLLEGRALKPGTGFVSPAIIDVTDLDSLPDEETFGPLLTIRRVSGISEAIHESNSTRYGLAAGIVTRDRSAYEEFRNGVNVGVVNWNQPLTLASSAVPFGGVGLSGNFRPSAYYAIDSCMYPVSCLEADAAVLPKTPPPGLPL